MRSPTNNVTYPDKPSRDKPRDPRDQDNRPAPESLRRSASPKPASERDSDERPQLPTRSKPNTTSTPAPAAPVSFKVKPRDDSRGPEPHDSHHNQEQQQRHHRDSDGDRQHHSSAQFDPEPMDEDEEEEEEVEVEDGGMGDMAAMMGFGGFGTTKGKKVLGNNAGATRKESKTEYRQYMNRVGGFNRPLSPGR